MGHQRPVVLGDGPGDVALEVFESRVEALDQIASSTAVRYSTIRPVSVRCAAESGMSG